MTGLVAIFNPQGLKSSLADVVDRFPTRAAKRDSWVGPTFAAARLHHGVIDPDPQPFWDESGRFCVFADGEAFDDSRGLQLAARCAALLRGSPSAFADLNGSFAVIAFDKQREQVIVVSDRLNTRPLYWFRIGGELVIANQIAALTAHPDCPRTLNRQTLHEMMAWRQVLGGNTIYRGIKLIEPASVTIFDARSHTSRAYWQLKWSEPSFSRKELPEAIADGIRKAVRRRMARGMPHGLFLSGGLDSRIILAACDTPPVCLTLGDIETEQVRCAREAARLKSADHHFLYVDHEGFADFFEEGVRLTGALYGYQTNHFLPVADRAREHAPVVFSGSYLDTFLRGSRMPTAKLSLGGSSTALPWLANVDKGDLAHLLVHSQKQAFSEALVRRVLTREAADEQEEQLLDVVYGALSGFAEQERLHAWSYVIFRSISRNYAFPNVTSIRSRLDATIVAWDHDVLNVALQMRPEWGWPDDAYRQALKLLSPSLAKLPYANDGLPTDASIYRRAASDVLNASLRAAGRRLFDKRPLAGPGSWLDFDSLLRRSDVMRLRLEHLADSEALAECGIFDRNGVRTVVGEHLSGRRNIGKFLVLLLTIKNWVAQFGGVRDVADRSRRGTRPSKLEAA